MNKLNVVLNNKQINYYLFLQYIPFLQLNIIHASQILKEKKIFKNLKKINEKRYKKM